MAPASRIGCLFVPELPLAAQLRAEPELRGRAVAVHRREGSRPQVVQAASPGAKEAGVIPGMGVPQARGILPELILRPLDPARVRSAQAALLDVARSFSPRVALEPGGEVCLDLGGLARLHPSEQKLAASLVLRAEEAGLPARASIASTRLCARMAARTTEGFEVVEPGRERAFLAPLPVHLLEAAADLQATLRRFGIERLGQLAELPPRGLGRRLGPAGLRLWRLARGEDQGPLEPDRLPERFVEETECSYPICQVEPLLFVLQGVFGRLSDRLQFRGLSARRLILSLGLDPDGADERFCDLAACSTKCRTWISVARLSLEEDPPRAPVAEVRVEAEVVQARPDQLDLFELNGPVPARLNDALARLAALSGDERVGSPRLVDSHRPEDFTLVPFGTREKGARLRQPPAQGLRRPGGSGGQGALRAVRPPERVQVRMLGDRPLGIRGGEIQGRVLQFAGPWRLEGGWWEEGYNRDYYEVELSDGGIYRVYQDRGSKQWFLDGVCG